MAIIPINRHQSSISSISSLESYRTSKYSQLCVLSGCQCARTPIMMGPMTRALVLKVASAPLPRVLVQPHPIKVIKRALLALGAGPGRAPQHWGAGCGRAENWAFVPFFPRPPAVNAEPAPSRRSAGQYCQWVLNTHVLGKRKELEEKKKRKERKCGRSPLSVGQRRKLGRWARAA